MNCRCWIALCTLLCCCNAGLELVLSWGATGITAKVECARVRMRDLWPCHMGMAVSMQTLFEQGVKYLGLPEAAAFAASEAKEAASPDSLPGPDLQSLGSPAAQYGLKGFTGQACQQVASKHSLHRYSVCKNSLQRLKFHIMCLDCKSACIHKALHAATQSTSPVNAGA